MPKDGSRSIEKEVDLFDPYAENPELADKLVFGRVPHNDRRGLLRGAGLAAMGELSGAAIPFHRDMPAGFTPEALAATGMEFKGRNGLTVLNDRPANGNRRRLVGLGETH